jgi:hypothetical protein
MDWTQITLAIITIAVPPLVAFAVQALRSMTTSLKAQAGQSTLDKARTFALLLASNFAEKQLVEIAKKVEAKELTTATAIKAELRDMGQDAVTALLQAVPDAAATLGPDAAPALIRWAADKVSPFPGKDTAVALLEGGAKVLIEKGLSAARNATIAPPAGE